MAAVCAYIQIVHIGCTEYMHSSLQIHVPQPVAPQLLQNDRECWES